jgi:LytS/YehU family sensor histidine kinase
LRQPEELKVRLQVPEQLPQELKVAPFILTPFVENAFKHAEKSGFISISLVLEEGKIVFEVRNSASTKAKAGAGAGGIGLRNVQRRLALIYPQRHQLIILPTANEFYVQLTLIL